MFTHKIYNESRLNGDFVNVAVAANLQPEQCLFIVSYSFDV